MYDATLLSIQYHLFSIEAGHFLLFLVFLRCGFTLLFPRILPILTL